jgi:hypothetical protein
MSEVGRLVPDCIQANPDIAGIGIRLSVYIQNLFTFLIAVSTLTDGKITKAEGRVVVAQSRVLLLTARSLLFSAFVQVKTFGMSEYHAIVILNLTWISTSNIFLLWLLRLVQDTPTSSTSPSPSISSVEARWPRPNPKLLNRQKTFISSLFQISLPLCILSAFGLWFWDTVDTFGAGVQCVPRLPIPLRILGHTVLTTSPSTRKGFILVYGFLVVPYFNLFPFVICAFILFMPFLFIFFKWSHLTPEPEPEPTALAKQAFRLFAYFGLALIIALEVVIIVDTESMIQDMKPFVQSGEFQWTFGQTLSLFLLGLPIGEFLRCVKELVESAEAGEQGERWDSSENQKRRDDLNSFCGLPRLLRCEFSLHKDWEITHLYLVITFSRILVGNNPHSMHIAAHLSR